MSYIKNLGQIEDRTVSRTQELVNRFARAIDDGSLAPGERLPSTRELARQAKANPTTAARVYRRLGELGYVTAGVGRGTFVRDLPPFASAQLDDDWQSVALRSRAGTSRERYLQDAMRMVSHGDAIGLSIGYPAPESLPVAQIAAASAAVFAESGSDALAYTDVEGLPELREQLARLGARQGFCADSSEIVVTSGARQAIDLVARAILAPGDVVCVESPSFVGTLGSLETTGARLLGVPTDTDGLDIEALELVLSRYPVKLVALQPVCQNPTGRSLSPERRTRLLELARARSFFVLEDGVYSHLDFDREAPISLRSEAPGHVIYVDSLSKTAGGGLRIGWLAARGPVFSRLVEMKMASDLNTSSLAQRIAASYLASGEHGRLLARLRPFYKQRAQSMLDALRTHLGDEADVLQPLGGSNVWVTLRTRINERELYTEALRRGVDITPGHAVLVEPSLRPSMRLSFSLPDEEAIDEGVRRLASAIHALARTTRLTSTAPVS